MGIVSEVQCPNGHSWPAAFRFCPACGSPTEAADVAADPDIEERFSDDLPSGDRPDPFLDTEAGASGPAPSPAGRPVPRFEALQSRGVLTAASILVVASAVVAGVVAGEGWFWSHSHQTSSVYGTVTLDDVAAAQHNCTGAGAYRDISADTVVVLTNQDGKLLGRTTLGEGKETSTPGNCVFIFTLADVPNGETAYSLEISHHTRIVKTNAEMAGANWTFIVAYGDHGAEVAGASPTAAAGN